MTERTTSTTIDAVALKKALPKLQTALTAFNKGVRIYRGLTHTDSKFRYKAQMPFGSRVSRNTDNYYTLIVDHDPDWSNYPPRSASVICTTQRGVSMGYGTPYVVLPEGDPLIGICSSSDYWDSYQRVHDMSNGYGSLSDLNFTIRMMAKQLVHIDKFQPTDYNHLVQVLEIIDEEILAHPVKWSDHVDSADWKMREQAKLLTKTPEGSLLDKIQWLLKPEPNGFAHAHLSEMSQLPDSRELWMHASIYMINTYLLPEGWESDTTFDLKAWIEQL